jgi:tetratricopeptide (TPR) repeat protein
MKRILTIVCSIFLFFIYQPCHGQTVAEILQQSADLSSRKSYLDALVVVERGLDKYPDNLLLLLDHAHLNDARGERLLAFRDAFSLQLKYPGNDTVLNYLGMLYEHSGMLDSALSIYQKQVSMARSKKERFGAMFNIGSVYNYMQQYRSAITHYEAMRVEYGDSLNILANLAQAYADNGQKEKAVGLMEQILRVDSSFDGGHNNLGLLYTQMGNHTAASKVFEIGIRRTPEDALLLNNYGYLLYKMKDYRKALLNINKSISLYNTNPYAYRNRALVYLDMKLMKEACTDLKASSELGFKTYYGTEVEELIAKYCK